MYAKSGSSKHAEAARKAGATQSELKAASMKKEEYELTEEDKHVKMAMGILNDKRYKGGNLKGAVNAIEKMKPGLSKHPAVQKAMQRANEEVEQIDELKKSTLASYIDKSQADKKERSVNADSLTNPMYPKNKENSEKAKEMRNKVGKRNLGIGQAYRKIRNEPPVDYSKGTDTSNTNVSYKKSRLAKEEVELDEAESPFTSYKDKTKPSIMAPKSHTAKKTEKGTMYTKNWSKKDMEHKDDKPKNEAVEDKEHGQHVRIAGETDMNTKTVDGLRGRMKVPADYHNKSKSYKVALNVEEAEHDDEKEDKALVKKMVKKDALKKTDEAFKGPEAGSGVGDHPFVTSEAKPLKNARELAKKTMHRIKNEMLGKISN
jgi:hypothetical protein